MEQFLYYDNGMVGLLLSSGSGKKLKKFVEVL